MPNWFSQAGGNSLKKTSIHCYQGIGAIDTPVKPAKLGLKNSHNVTYGEKGPQGTNKGRGVWLECGQEELSRGGV